MIEINLLPISEFRHRQRGRVFLAAMGLSLLVLIAGLYSFKSNIMDANLEKLAQNADSQSMQLMKLQKDVAAASLATGATVKKWRQLSAIIELEERRRDLTRILVELDKLLPRDSAWLSGLSHSAGGLTIEGISKDKEIISQFLSQLEKAEYIAKSSVNLLEIAQNMVINEVSLTRFKINAQTIFPRPRVLDSGLPDLGLPPREEMIKAVEAAAPALAAAIKAGAALPGKTL